MHAGCPWLSPERLTLSHPANRRDFIIRLASVSAAQAGSAALSGCDSEEEEDSVFMHPFSFPEAPRTSARRARVGV
jgi:hypothetical protein